MADNPQELQKRLEHLEGVVKRFSPEDWDTLHKLTRAYISWSMLGAATKWFVLLLASISGLIITLNHLGETVKRWLLGS